MRLAMVNPVPPVLARRGAALVVIFAAGIALGACSSGQQAQYDYPSWANAQPAPQPPTRRASYEPSPGDPIQDAPVEPLRRPNAMPDDPSEPFSPNYGGPRTQSPVRVSNAGAPAAPAYQAAAVRPLPTGSTAYFRRVTTTAAAD